ncbi:aldo/keto reductase [Rhodobacteraceae bacterium NNCM2]|nr:aldo/keto reductase [Coraliihabitans acroporae]
MTRLGRTGVEVSELCAGTMSFGGDADEAESGRIYAACRDAGINFFDCANVYNGGRAEEILGRLVAGHREELILTSKVASPARPGINGRGASRRHVVAEVDKTLKRLGTDHVDILFLHRWDEHVPMEDQLRTMEDILRAGKALYLGASNWSAWQYAKALGIADGRGWQPIDVIQPMYSLAKRQAEVEILPMAMAEGLAVTSYSPVGGGLLSGKYSPWMRPDSGRIIEKPEYTKRYGPDWLYDVAASFTELAAELGQHPVSLAVAWAGAHPGITCPIIGARSVEQLRPSLESVAIDMTPDLHARISALSPTPPPATDRLEEQA